MRYLTYEEYLNIGGTLEKAAFERVIGRACGVVDYYTFNRARNVSGGAYQEGDELVIVGEGSMIASDRVKACTRDLCEYISGTTSTDGKAITTKTQSAGGVSESVNYATKTDDELNVAVRGIVFDYLANEVDDYGTPLLYRGCRP